jgi:transportin-1
VRIIKQQLMQAQACTQDPTLEPPDKDFLIVSLDLLSGLVQGLGQLSEPFIMASDPPILTLMGMSMQVSYLFYHYH